jgi:hypothetical protein
MHHIKAWLRSKRQDKSSGAAHRSVPDDEKRQVEAACQEFAGSGYAAISVETVARGAGNSTKTQYRLIPNKGRLPGRCPVAVFRRCWSWSPNPIASGAHWHMRSVISISR